MPKKRKETPVSSEGTGSPSVIMKNCTDSKRGAAQYVYDLLRSSPEGLLSIITIRPEKYEDSSVISVTIESSEDTLTANFYDGWLSISKGKPDGSPQKK